MPVDLLLQAVSRGQGGSRLKLEDLCELLPRLGCEVEEVAHTRQYHCRVCGRVYDRTEAQGPPISCTSCGTGFRAQPESLEDLGPNTILRLNMLPVRPDLFDPGGMARCIRGFLGIDSGLAEYAVAAPRLRVQVDPLLSSHDSYRPFIACAVVRNVRLDHATIKLVMNLQEDLHWALGRDRKLASIGVYDLDRLAGEVFHYEAVDPDGLKFVPLGFSPQDSGSLCTPRQILERHPTGKAYAHLLVGFSRYPLLRDGVGTVLSMPPIINSEQARVTLETRQFFIDVTGLAQRVVDRALNIIVTSLKEVLPAAQLECVVIESPTGVRLTPDLSPTPMLLSVQEASETVGIPFNAGQLAELLESMCHAVDEAGHADRIQVWVPAWRVDVMHPVDLIEDAAIAYGYENLPARLVPTLTLGTPLAIEEHSVLARRIMTGLGFHQVMTLALSSEEAAFLRWNLPPDPQAVLIENPISVEQTLCRVSLLPGLLETLAANKQYELPQQVFEVGDCCRVDPQAETGAREERMVAAAIIGTHAGYADVRGVADALVQELGAACRIEPVEHPSFIPGRVAGFFDAGGTRLGTMGELHPAVLENYGLRHPVAVLEVSLEKLLRTSRT